MTQDDEQQRIWKVHSSTYLYKKPWLTVRSDDVELPNGAHIPEYFVLEYPEWVGVVAVTKDGKMIMERQYRHGLGRFDYEICAGVCDPTDKDFLAAAQRELMEETGFGGGHWELLSEVSANPGTHSNLVHCFLATDVEQLAPSNQEATEDISVVFLSKAEVYDLLVRDEIKQAMHAVPLWKYMALHPDR
jgi:ADP-ribose pyrophosphatase